MILYLIKSALCLTLMIAAYHLLLARAGTFRFNRFFLLFGICFSLITPLVQVEMLKEAIPAELPVVSTISKMEEQMVAFESPEIEMVILDHAQEDSKRSIYNFIELFVLFIYLLVALTLLLRYFDNIRKLLNTKKSTEIVHYENVQFNLVDEDTVPHSFLNHIFIGKEDYRNGMSTELLTHELAHVQQKHSWDILFVEFIKIIFWFNPVLYLYARDIRMNHEYLADRTVIDNHKNVSGYQHQLIQYLSRFKSPPFSSQLNYSLTKKRFEMMKKKISKTAAVIGITALVPIMIFAMMAFSPAIKKVEKSIETGVAEIKALVEPEVLVEENYVPSISPINNSELTRLSSGYGQRLDPFTKEKKWHFGLDFSADTGVNVFATADGIIAVAKIQKNGYGNHVRINHGNGYETLYAHMNELKVSVEESVKMGDVIGTVGSTGRSAAPHLHYAVIKDDRHVNPIEFIGERLIETLQIKATLEDLPELSIPNQGGGRNDIEALHIPKIETKKEFQEMNNLYSSPLDSPINYDQTVSVVETKPKEEEYPYGLPIEISKMTKDITIIKRPKKSKKKKTQVDIFGSPLLIVDGLRESKLSDIDASNIAAATIIENEAAIYRYGKEGANGAILIKTKQENRSNEPSAFNEKHITTLEKSLKVLSSVSSDVIKIELENEREEWVFVNVVSVYERKVIKSLQRKKLKKGRYEFEWDSSKERPGIYMVFVQNKKEWIHRKFIVSHNAASDHMDI